MSDISPYAPPVRPDVPDPSLPMVPPSRIRVFGILHLVFGGAGLLLLAGTVVVQQFSRAMLETQLQEGGHQAAQAQFSFDVEQITRGVTWMQQIGTVVLAALLIKAGIDLLKKRKSGLRWSNVYGWTAIALRICTIAGFFIFCSAEVELAVERFAEATDFPQAHVMAMAMQAGIVGSALAYCIYPILSLILLNKEGVRRALS